MGVGTGTIAVVALGVAAAAIARAKRSEASAARLDSQLSAVRDSVTRLRREVRASTELSQSNAHSVGKLHALAAKEAAVYLRGYMDGRPKE
jgi:hypothetical protein